MKQSEAAAFLPLIEAWSKGETLQFYLHGNWVDKRIVTFSDPPDQYRIKPLGIWVAVWWHKTSETTGFFESAASYDKEFLERTYGSNDGVLFQEIVRDGE